MMIEDDILTIDLWSDELPYIYEYTFNLNDESNKSSIGENNFIFNVTDYEGNVIPTECNHEILTGPNYVTISSDGVVVGQIILPTEEFGECEVVY
jgi:restriction endonuclease S subunit